MAGKAKTQFYIDFLRKTIAGRPFEGTTGTIRDRIGAGINYARVRTLSGLGLAQAREGRFRFRLTHKGGLY